MFLHLLFILIEDIPEVTVLCLCIYEPSMAQMHHGSSVQLQYVENPTKLWWWSVEVFESPSSWETY